MLSYSQTAGGNSPRDDRAADAHPRTDTGIGFIAGVAVDPERKEVYAVNNDGGGVVVFGYDQTGAVRPVRRLETPHQTWGVTLSMPRDELAVSVQQLHGIVFYQRGAQDMDPPLRTIRGYDTGLADPHGVAFDDDRKELVVANHGNWTELRPYSPYDPLSKDPPSYQPGRFEAPSIRVFAASAEGNAKPLRSISGDQTGLNWPMGLEIDVAARRDRRGQLRRQFGPLLPPHGRRRRRPARVSQGRQDRHPRSGGRQHRPASATSSGLPTIRIIPRSCSTVTPAATWRPSASSAMRPKGTPALDLHQRVRSRLRHASATRSSSPIE